MAKTGYTIIYWNTWFEMQDGSRGDGTSINQRLGKLIVEYSPDAFGLNEVFANTKTGESPLLEFLKKAGYNTHFCEFGQTANGWSVGSALATRQKLKRVVNHQYGPNTQSRRRLFKNHASRLIEGRVDIGGTEITILVNHFCALNPVDFRTHIRQRRGYRQIITNINSKNLIIGGDYNETKYMLSWPRTPKSLERKTGNLRQPTWRFNGKRRYLVMANLDNIFYLTTGRLNLQGFQVLDRWPSDHSPLLARFEIR
jgi:endonuclease/exonuclease/phosphatase (EEP) superfamily protein YafD